MDEETARDMDRLLAGGELSGPEADAIYERVTAELERRERERRPSVIRYWAAGSGAVLAAAAAVMLLVVRDPGGGERPQYEEGTIGKKPVVEIRCEGGTLAACPLSGSLVFAVSGNRKAVVLSAWAERVEIGSGTAGQAEPVIYFEKDGGGVEIAPAGENARAVERKVALSAGHEPGRYRVHAVVAEGVLGREEMLRMAGGDGVAQVKLVVVE